MASWLTRLIALAGAAAAIEIAKTLSESARQPDGNRSVPPPQPEPAPVPADSRHVQTDASHAPVTPEVFADRTDVFVPACKPFPAAEVRQITLTEQEAIAAGWHFDKKSRHRARIRRYTGKETDITVPSQIGAYTVNALGRQFLMQRQDIQTVRIPSAVKKLAYEVFASAGIRKCIFAPGVLHLPVRAFADCRQLTHVHLPGHLQTIGADAFCGCSALKTLHLPPFLKHTCDGAFRSSGLESFTVCGDPSARGTLTNGAAIAHTPLTSKYNVVCAAADNQTVRYLYIKPGRYRFPAGNAEFFPHSLPAEGVLDMRDTAHLRADLNAAPSQGFGRLMSDLTFILPQDIPDGCCGRDAVNCIPAQVQLAYPDGTSCPAGLERQTAAGGANTLLFRRALGPGSITENDTEILVQEPGTGRLTVCENAVGGYRLKTALFREIRPEGAIFASWCRDLHTVRWFEESGEIVKYIPPAGIIGGVQHAALLEAFTLRQDGIFFDEKLIEKVFLSDFYTSTSNSSRITFRISQRTKILTAIDMLRGTHRPCDPPLAVYAEYLIGHIRYAKILAKKYPEYAVGFLDYPKLYEIQMNRINWHPPRTLSGSGAEAPAETGESE